MSLPEQPQPFEEDLQEAEVLLPNDELLAYRIVSAAVDTLSPDLAIQPETVADYVAQPMFVASGFDTYTHATPTERVVTVQDTVERAIQGLTTVYNRFANLKYDRFPVPTRWLGAYILRETGRGNIVVPELVQVNPDQPDESVTGYAVITKVEKNVAHGYDPISNQKGLVDLSKIQQYAAQVGIWKMWSPIQVIGHPLGRRWISGSR